MAVSLAEAAQRYKRAARKILETYEARRPAQTDQVTPGQIDAGVEQFLTLADKFDREPGSTKAEEVTQLGDYGLNLLTDLIMWANQLDLVEVGEDLDQVSLAFADWIVRHGGEVRTLEPIVDALAHRANRTRDPAALETLTHFMTRVVHATANVVKQDLEPGNPGRPWRVLNLNRGIVATRSHNPRLMAQVFDELVIHLPGDAAQFFAEGMQQMDELKYPPHVREVMSRYFDRWTRRTMH